MARKRKQTAVEAESKADKMRVVYSPEVLKSLKSIQPTSPRECGKTYISAFVTFFDILGFKNWVSTKSDEEINSILDGMFVFSSQAQRRSEPYDNVKHLPMVSQFSDSIIRIQPVTIDDSNTNISDIFAGEIQALLLTQGNLACNGILIRGGMTYGNICVHAGRMFGPAFNRAYFLESCIAKYPRLIVDELLCSQSEKENPLIQINGIMQWHSDFSQISEDLERTDDGLWHINYLPALCLSERQPQTPGIDVLLAHRDHLYKLLKEAEGKIDILIKIRWAISYHNRIIQRNFKKLFNEYEGKNNSLLIDL